MSTTSGRGRFITFEGLDGCGKSSIMRRIAERLREQGHTVYESAEPGGTPIGQQIRQILLDHRNHELSPVAELLLMFAARAQNVDQGILPALKQGHIVLSDRFTDSSVAYQGSGRGLGVETVLEVDRVACRGLVPDATIYIEIDPLVGLARAQARNRREEETATRLDEQEVDFYRKAQQGYRQIAADEPERVRVIDGSGTLEEVEARVWREVETLLR